jgi:antitoxin CcdA
MSSRAAQMLLLAQGVATLQGGSESDTSPGRKRATNVTIDAHVLAEAKQMGINLSQTLETALREIIKQMRIKEFSTTNKNAIASYNSLVTPPQGKP